MSDKTTGLRCHDADACAMGQKTCPSPEACGCAPMVQPEALRLASDLRRVASGLHAASTDNTLENSANELESLTAALNEWHDKTEWVQKTSKGKELGKHRADVLRERITDLEAQLSAIGAGGVESLRKRDDSMVRKADVIARLEQGFGAGSAVVMTIKHFFSSELPRQALHQIAEPSRECLQQSAEAEVLLRVIQRLNQNPYSLTKSECISEVSAMRDAALQAPAGVAVPDEDAAATKGLRAGWRWARREAQQADSEYVGQHKKADATQAKFQELVEETRSAIAAAPAQAVAVPKDAVAAALIRLDAIYREETDYGESRPRPAWLVAEALRLASLPAQEHATQLAGQGREDARDAVLSEIICEMDELLKNGALPYSLESLLDSARAAQGQS